MLKLILLLLLSQTSKCLFINSGFIRHNIIRKCFIDDDIMDGFEDDNNEPFGLRISYNKNSSIYKSFKKNINKSIKKY